MNPKALLVLGVSISLQIAVYGHCGAGSDLTQEELKALEKKALAGDAKTAMHLWNLYTYSIRDEDTADKWLRKAAELKEPEAQRWLAHMIVKYGRSPEPFGKTPEEAVLKLLSESAQTNGPAARELGQHYYEGYFGTDRKNERAREAFRLSVSHHNSWGWELLAGMLHRGEGGDANQAVAYYYICLATQCTHPESVGGEELWVLRRKIERKLTLDQAKKVWSRVDAYISKERMRSGGRIYPPPLLGTGIPEDQWNEALRVTDQYEARHRKQWETKTGEQGSAGQPATAPESKSEGEEQHQPESEGRSR